MPLASGRKRPEELPNPVQYTAPAPMRSYPAQKVIALRLETQVRRITSSLWVGLLGSSVRRRDTYVGRSFRNNLSFPPVWLSALTIPSSS